MHPRLSELMGNAGVAGDFGGSAVNESGRSAPSDVSAVIQGATDQIERLQTVTQTNVDSVTANTDALSNHLGSQSSSTSAGLVSDIGSSASGILGGGGLLGGLLGGGGLIGDAISGLIGLFGGGGSSKPDFTQYQAPAAQHFELATSGGSTGDAVDAGNGQPRIAPVTELGLLGIQSLNDPPAASSGANNGNSSSNQQVTVNVQAMDSQSFMDRSTDIAQAVRSAMLNMSSINDVINDL